MREAFSNFELALFLNYRALERHRLMAVASALQPPAANIRGARPFCTSGSREPPSHNHPRSRESPSNRLPPFQKSNRDFKRRNIANWRLQTQISQKESIEFDVYRSQSRALAHGAWQPRRLAAAIFFICYCEMIFMYYCEKSWIRLGFESEFSTVTSAERQHWRMPGKARQLAGGERRLSSSDRQRLRTPHPTATAPR